MDMDQVICHCANGDCSKCPVKNIGTAGSLAIFDFFKDIYVKKP